MPTNPDANWFVDDSLQDAATIAVYRWTAEGGAEPLPHVRCLSVRRGEGPDPGSAVFRYDLSISDGSAPASIEEALGTQYSGPGIVEPGDNLFVVATSPTGYSEPIFDGFALAFEGGLGPGSEEVRIEAEGVAKRLWDNPLSGSVMRSAAAPYSATSNVATDVPGHFNRDGLPNRTPDGTEASLPGYDDYKYHVFFDQAAARTDDVRSLWSLADAVAYLLYVHNDEEWVLNPTPAEIAALSAVGDPVDPIDPTPTVVPLAVPDYPFEGKDLPGTCFDLVREYGFAMRFDVAADAGGIPETTLAFFNHQAGEVKDVYLPPRGSAFDPYSCNLQAGTLRRSLSEVANRWEVLGRMERYEVSVVLAPGFPSQSSDGSAANLKNFDRSGAAFDATYRDAYRAWVFNEAGDGYYAAGSTTKLLTIPSLDDVLDRDGETPYVDRRRVPLADLIAVGPDLRPLKARLDISTDYAGDSPGLWDGTGTWQEVTTSTWQLLRDRLGIWVSEENPNRWHIGESSVSGHPYRGGVVRAVEAIAGSEATIPAFKLRLTCVIEGDRRLRAVADRRGRSPLSTAIARQIDARDRYFYDVQAAKSLHNPGDDPAVVTDDADKAQAEAEARRAAAELGVLDGTLAIPYITTQYRIGDRIRSVAGRGLGLRTDASDAEGSDDDPATYPVVTGVAWATAAPQSTTLTLSDAGTARFKYARRMVRRGMDS